MKKIKNLLALALVMLSLLGVSQADYEIGIAENSSEYMEVQIRINGDFPLPNNSNVLIQNIEFGIMWKQSIVAGNKLDITFICDDEEHNPYHLEQKGNPVPYNAKPEDSTELWDYRNFGLIDGPHGANPSWVKGEWTTIAKLQVYQRTPGGDPNNFGNFYIVPSIDFFKNNAIDPILDVTGQPPYDLSVLSTSDSMGGYHEFLIPTEIYGYTWIGGEEGIVDGEHYDKYSWNYGPNWLNGCGYEDHATKPPGIYDDCIIPQLETDYYPRYTKLNNPEEDTAFCQDASVDGGKIEWMKEPNSMEEVFLQTQGFLHINGSVEVYSNGRIDIGGDTIEWIAPLNIYSTNGLIIKDGGIVNVKDKTSIKNSEALIIESNVNGTGSFINTGEVTYSNGGTVRIQTFVSGEDDVYHMHFVGPTVTDVAYGIGGELTGVRLEQFNMTTLDTYAYEWTPFYDISVIDPSIHLWHGWINVWPFEWNEPIATGISITNFEEAEGTMNMVGYLNSDINIPVQYQINWIDPLEIENQLELISNPFSSAIDFSLLYDYGNNSQYILPSYRIWDDDGGNYGGGVYIIGDDLIQVGQGFFVETIESGMLEFPTSIRKHSDVAFRSVFTPKFIINVYGVNNYKDKLTIYFTDEATNYYDENLELKKWNSIRPDATMIRSISNGGDELAINAIPLEDLYADKVNVPVHFQCGYDGEYTFDFSGYEDFAGIWIEDKMAKQPIGGDPIKNHLYTFTASPNDDVDRFVIHFFTPSSYTDDIIVNNDNIKIYSYRNNVYVKSVSDETIKEIIIYNLLGQEVYKTRTVDNIKINDKSGYYIVKVRTDKNIYTEKVFIM